MLVDYLSPDPWISVLGERVSKWKRIQYHCMCRESLCLHSSSITHFSYHRHHVRPTLLLFFA